MFSFVANVGALGLMGEGGHTVVPPQEYVREVTRWVEAGARSVGRCPGAVLTS